ncbi:MAG TPA: DNA ligase D [Candidatus Paceibacterota bacterium]|jgi:bifunctional non-homologous end joining protein LigD
MSLLGEYNRKRSFKKTPEPKGAVKKSAGPLHFVVQKHDATRLHYDFRLEIDGVLKSWAVPKGPSLNPSDKRLAMMTEDHPYSYKDFEGVIPAGEYGGGDVIVWDTGVFASSESSGPEDGHKKLKSGLHRGELSFVLFGEKLKGGFKLVKIQNGKEDNAWLLMKAKDEYAEKRDVTEDTASVLSGRILPRDVPGKLVKKGAGLQAVTAGMPKKEKTPAPPAKKAKRGTDPMPRDVSPMLATLIDAPFDRAGWIYEMKWDGYRAVAEVEGGDVRLYSRNGKSFAGTYTPVVTALKSLGHDAVLDGEIIALKDGRPDFHALQQYKDAPVPLQYAIFDALWINGEDLRELPLIERKERLVGIIPESPHLFVSEHIEEHGTAFFEEMRKQSFEGMLAKDGQSRYVTKSRSKSWLKVKTSNEQEAVIVGYTEPRGSRKSLGALVLAAHINGVLTYIGHSGGGFTGKELADLCKKLSKVKVNKSPIAEKVPINSPITWVKPHYVCQVKFTEWTPSGRMRHPIYVGLRVDKEAKDVVKESPEDVGGGSELTPTPPKKAAARAKAATATETPFTNLTKVYWEEEGITKGDLIDYYQAMAPLMLPYLKDRPENLNRHPNGWKGKNFYQKDMKAELPDFARSVEIWSESNKAELRYLVCDNEETLLYMANLGCIEINPWNSRVTSIDNPDYMVFDLDPDTNTMDELVEVAQEFHKVLTRACEEHYIKTSGKTGLHIYVPLNGRYGYDQIRTFSELVCRLVHRKFPKNTSLERSVSKRKGQIYLDYMQNRFGQTIAAPYSVRPAAGATVSTPLEWSEVRKGLDPTKFTIKTIGKRLEKKGDLWEPVLGKGVDLAASIKCLEAEF